MALARADSVSRELQQARERAGRLELVPASNAFPALERAAQVAATALGKTIRFEATGGDVRLDRRVLPVVNDALLHLVRNAVDHGIETAATRDTLNKPSEGCLKISVQRRGNRVAFGCEDDGGGIDPNEIRRLAASRGLYPEAEAAQLDDAAALRLLFRAGFSTRDTVTDLSGRGVGLDVVSTAASTLHGDTTISSIVGVGTRIEVVVPVSLTTATVVVLRVEDASVLLPIDSVSNVVRTSVSSITSSPRGEVLLHENDFLPVLRLGKALGLGNTQHLATSQVAALVLSVGEERFAIVADAAQGTTEVVVRPLPWSAGNPLGVAGAALDVEGVTRLVLDPRGLLAVLQRHAGIAPEPALPSYVRRHLPILVVDDSLTTRMLEQSILQTAGFEVDVATSAEEGLGMARAREYGLFVVDVEMPGMNGFEFTTLTRNDARLKNVSVILVTSLCSEADKTSRSRGWCIRVRGQRALRSKLLPRTGSNAFPGGGMKPLKVLVVDDSITVRERIVGVLADDPTFEVVGQAGDGLSAIRICEREYPDVISLDMVLPAMSGLEVTRRIMSTRATPILVVSASINRGEAFSTLDALQAGAVDIFEKARINQDDDWVDAFKAALRLVARIKVVTRPKPRASIELEMSSQLTDPHDGSPQSRLPCVVALGASTGGPAAIARVLNDLPSNFPLPILVALHMASAFSSPLIEWLGRQTSLAVRMATDGEPLPTPRAGSPVIVAPPDRHLLVDAGRLRLTLDPERHACRPSVDVLFESLAVEIGRRAIAGLLTGMGRDGAAGLLALSRMQALTFAQDEGSCVVFGMPKEAILLGAAESILPLSQIGPYLVDNSRARIERRAI